jgi:hypothetical protein
MNKKLIFTLLTTFSLLTVIAAACAPQAATPTPIDLNAAMTQALATVAAQSTQTAMAVPTATETPVPTATALRTPPALPATYQTTLLNSLDTPHTYEQDTCTYLKNKWSSTNAAPGTVVMVIMVHSVNKGEANSSNAISSADYKKLMNDLHDQGFEAINTQQMADFMDSNAYIPQRSVLLIQDDRHSAENFNDHFRTYWDKWGWPIVNAWISTPNNTPQLWQENVELEKEGWVDHQAHGVVHNIPMGADSSDEFIRGELQGSIDAFQQYFNKKPIAIIWPGGGFALRPVQIARELGYRLGFTVNPRGPVMYNWIPQADQADPQRPYYMAEGPAGDPRMTIPRYWDTDARSHIDLVRNISNDAAAYAQQNKATELEYYDIVCAPSYGPMP